MRIRILAAFAAAALISHPVQAADSQALRDVRILSADDMEGRLVGSPGGAKARSYLLDRVKAIGLRPFEGGFEQGFTDGTRNGVNIVGRIEGTSASDKVLVVMAHYDHLGVKDGKIYNGADDNASGVAGLLAVAEAFKTSPPQHTVIFALVDGEEGGISGSKAFVAKPPVPLARIAMAMNFDMISKNSKNELYVSGGHHFPWLRPRLDRLADEVPVILKQGHDGPPWTGHDDWTTQSDHYAFHMAKVPWVYFGVEDHPEYHQPSDDVATVPAAFFDKAVASVVTAAKAFDRDLDGIAKAAGR